MAGYYRILAILLVVLVLYGTAAPRGVDFIRSLLNMQMPGSLITSGAVVVLALITGTFLSRRKDRKKSTACPLCTLTLALFFAGMFLSTASITELELIESVFGFHIPSRLLMYAEHVSSVLIAGALVGLCIDGLWIDHAQCQGQEE